ncbi:MAG: CHAP domain-containing protein, partial [Clostridia bacterium]|nr:CHAP domain-containing protein [Clostridia bacterium]
MTKNKWHSLLAATLTLLMLFVFIPQAQAIKANNDYSESYKSNKYYTNLMNVLISENQRDTIVNVALSQLEYHEGSNNNDLSGCSTGLNNYTEYNYWFEKGSAGWPATFVSWCARQAKIGTDIIKNASYSKPDEFGIAFYERGSYTPMCGDFIFFDWKSPNYPDPWDLVGIVESVNGNQVTF